MWKRIDLAKTKTEKETGSILYVGSGVVEGETTTKGSPPGEKEKLGYRRECVTGS